MGARQVGPDTFEIREVLRSSDGMPIKATAGITVTDLVNGGAAKIYSDRHLETTIGSLASDNSGVFSFFVPAGRYRIEGPAGTKKFEDLDLQNPMPLVVTPTKISVISRQTDPQSTQSIAYVDFVTYTIPGGTLAANGDLIEVEAFTSKTGINAGYQVNVWLGSHILFFFAEEDVGATGETAWAKVLIARRAASGTDSLRVNGAKNEGSVGAGRISNQFDVDWSVDQVLKIQGKVNHASDTLHLYQYLAKLIKA